MTAQEAQKIKKELLSLCERHNLFWDVTEKGRPELKDMVIIISMRIDDKK